MSIDKQALRRKAEKATKGEWWSDSCSNEGTYGSGDDCVEGYTSYAVYDENNQTLLDTLNSTAECINEEYDGECHVAWDEVGQRNAEFIAAANPATVLALLDELEAAQKLNAELDDRLLRYAGIATQRAEHVAELEKRVAELENDEVRQRLANAEHQLYMAELAKNNLRASRKAQFRKRRAAEKRIAELEARKLEVIIPPRLCHDYASVAVQQRDEQWYKALHEACDRAGINLETGGEA